MPQKKNSLCLNISLDVKCLKIVAYSFSSLFNEDEHDDISLTPHIFNTVLQNYEILDSNRNVSQLAFLEGFVLKIMILFLFMVSKPRKNFGRLIKLLTLILILNC